MISIQVNKMMVTAHAASDCSDSPIATYTAQVNPDSYTHRFALEINTDQAPGTSGTEAKSSKTLPEEISFQFLFDSTGVISNSHTGIAIVDPMATTPDIVSELEIFRGVMLTYNGEIHQPNYVKLVWGTFLFKGKLKSLDIEYKVFKPDGTPIRAFAKATFIGTMDDTYRVAAEGAESPDITHLVTVTDSDTLPLLCYKIYGDSGYYTAVAKANNLTSFRNIPAGTQLYFPPID